MPVYDISVSIIVQDIAKRVYLAPQMTPISFQQNGQKIDYVVPKLECHQMVVIDFEKPE